MALLAVGHVYCSGAAFRCGKRVAALCESAMRVSRGDHKERREQTASQSAPASKLFWTNGLSDPRRMDARGRPGRTGRKETKPATPRRPGASRQRSPSGPMPAAPSCGSRPLCARKRVGGASSSLVQVVAHASRWSSPSPVSSKPPSTPELFLSAFFKQT